MFAAIIPFNTDKQIHFVENTVMDYNVLIFEISLAHVGVKLTLRVISRMLQLNLLIGWQFDEFYTTFLVTF